MGASGRDPQDWVGGVRECVVVTSYSPRTERAKDPEQTVDLDLNLAVWPRASG